jgi:hypothetical protein
MFSQAGHPWLQNRSPRLGRRATASGTNRRIQHAIQLEEKPWRAERRRIARIEKEIRLASNPRLSAQENRTMLSTCYSIEARIHTVDQLTWITNTYPHFKTRTNEQTGLVYLHCPTLFITQQVHLLLLLMKCCSHSQHVHACLQQNTLSPESPDHKICFALLKLCSQMLLDLETQQITIIRPDSTIKRHNKHTYAKQDNTHFTDT